MASEDLDIWIRLKGARDAAGDVKHVRAEVTEMGRAAEKAGRKSRGMGRGFVYARKGLGPLRAGVTGLTGALGFGAGIGLIGAFGKMVSEARESQKAGRATSAALKSTGASAWISRKQIEKHANTLSDLAGVDDEVIQKGENLLLTFRHITNAAGKGPKTFDRTTKAALDMSAGMTAAGKSMDISSAFAFLGKALDDPVKGVTRLTRANILFTDQQKKQIEVLEKAGRHHAAQGIILAEVEKEFGGQAKSQADPVKKLGVILNNTAETIGLKFLPYIDKGATATRKFVTQFVDGTGQGGRFRDKLEQIWKAAKPVVEWFGRAVVNVGKFMAAHPGLVKVATALLLANKALKLMRFGSAISGVKMLWTWLGRAETRAETMPEKVAATQGKWSRAGSLLGKAFGLAIGIAAAPEIIKTANEVLKQFGVNGGPALDEEINRAHKYGTIPYIASTLGIGPAVDQAGEMPGAERTHRGGTGISRDTFRNTPHLNPHLHPRSPRRTGHAPRPDLTRKTVSPDGTVIHHHVFQVNGRTLFEAFTEEDRKRGNRR